MKTNILSNPARALRSVFLAAATLLTGGALQAANFFDNAILAGGSSGSAIVDLNTAGGSGQPGRYCWAIFALQGGVTITSPSVPGLSNVIGNIGIAQSGTLTTSNAFLSSASTVYLRTGAVPSNTGSTIVNPILQGPAYDAILGNPVSGAVLAANNAATAASSMSTQTTGLSLSGPFPTPPLLTNDSFVDTGSIVFGSTSGTINGAPGGTYVLNLTNLVLSASTLTLTGDASTNYVINVSRFMSLSSGSKIQLSGGLQPQNVLFNLRNSASFDVTLSGASTVDGIILAANRNVKLTGASVVTGEVIARGVSLSGNSRVINPVCSP